MKGVGRTIVQMLCLSNALQAWLLAIGLGATAIGLTGRVDAWPPAPELWSVLTILGAVTALAAPLMLDPLLFRAVSAPRIVQLIPQGKLKLVLGALASQLLLASFIGGVAAALLSIGAAATPSGASAAHIMATISGIAFGILTLHFIGFYWASQFKFGALWVIGYVLWPRLISAAIAPRHLGDVVRTGPVLGAWLAASLAGWLVFAVLYTRGRRVHVFYWGGVGPTPSRAPPGVAGTAVAHGPQHFSEQQALRLLLLGSARRLQRAAVLGLGAVLLIALVLWVPNTRISAVNWLVPAAALSLFASTVPGIFAGWMTLRARLLWLTSRLGRADLLRIIELRSWRILAFVAAIAFAVELPLFILSTRSAPASLRMISMLTMPLVTGASFIYVSLLGMYERRLVHMLVAAGCAAVLLADFVCLLADNAVLLPILLTVQVVLVSVLRNLAQRRWQRMDWLVNKPGHALLKVV
jgi:hypothetical protein